MVFTAIGHFMSVLHCTQEAYVCFYRNWLQMYESDSDWPRYVPTWVDASSQGIFDGKMLLGEQRRNQGEMSGTQCSGKNQNTEFSRQGVFFL